MVSHRHDFVGFLCPRALGLKKAASAVLLDSPSDPELPYKFGGEFENEDSAIDLPSPPPISLDRKSNLRKSMGFIILFFLLEVSKQTLNYKMATNNSGQYPVPTSVIMLFTELCKLILVASFTLGLGYSMVKYRPSARFGLPAFCYFITNIFYLSAIRSIPPPLWMILIQTRTLYTAIVYKVVFNRPVRPLQVLGCVLIVVSIPLAKLSDLADSEKTAAVTTYIIFISQGCALLSTIAAVSVEILLKNDKRSFSEQQIWLYTWGALYNIITIPVTVSMETLSQQFRALGGDEALLLFSAVLAAALAGLCIPVIVKNLDTIVKDYLGAANNLLLSIATALLFPTLFSFSWIFLSSLVVLFCGIIMYERCGAPSSSPPSPILSPKKQSFQLDKNIKKKKCLVEVSIA